MTEYKFTTGRSGSTVTLIKQNGKTVVRKDNVKNCVQVVDAMRSCIMPTPEVYEYDDNSLVMEYLPGMTVYEYLLTASKNDIDRLIAEISRYIKHCLRNSTEYDFSTEIVNKMRSTGVDINFANTVYPRSYIHGDLTFDNIVYYKDKFYFIDFNYTELNSVYFDVNKLRQDLDAYWFIRNRERSVGIKMQLNYIKCELRKQFTDMFDDKLYKFMLSRILPYVKDDERKFVESAIERI